VLPLLSGCEYGAGTYRDISFVDPVRRVAQSRQHELMRRLVDELIAGLLEWIENRS
jgi:hypothetical protein